MGDEETIEDIEETSEEEALEGVGPRKKLFGPTVVRTLIFVALALVLIIISGTIAYLVSRRAGAPPATEKISPEFVEKENPLAYFDMESFSINTSDTDEPHFLKLTLSLGYEKGTAQRYHHLNYRSDEIHRSQYARQTRCPERGPHA
jgi:flagellar basal body-associated protein FliL